MICGSYVNLSQPVIHLMYVGDLPVLCHPKNCQFHASLNPQFAPLLTMISQSFHDLNFSNQQPFCIPKIASYSKQFRWEMDSRKISVSRHHSFCRDYSTNLELCAGTKNNIVAPIFRHLIAGILVSKKGRTISDPALKGQWILCFSQYASVCLPPFPYAPDPFRRCRV